MAAIPPLGTADTSPFSPHFGKTPRSLVGRDTLLASLGDGLVTGVNDQRYTSVLFGVRGSGKTVILNEIEDRAAANGWVVLSLDAGTPGLLDRIVDAISGADDTHETIQLAAGTERRSVEKSLGFRLGPVGGRVTSREHRAPRVPAGLRESLTILARAAQEAGTSVLLTVDELHGIERMEARRLSNDMQHITRRAEMPVAFLGAGLPEMKHTLMRDRKMTFFHRCEHFDMPPIESGDALIGLARPIKQAGGKITERALKLAARSIAGSPYRLQVVGDFAWRVAEAPDGIIDTDAVEVAVAAAQETVNAKVATPAWHDLSEADQEILGSLAAAGGTSTAAGAARDLRINGKAASAALRRLADLGYATSPRRGVFSLSGLVPIDMVLEENGGHGDSEGRRPAVMRPAVHLCRQWMPRARAYCVMPLGHAGGCRSKHPGR